MTVWSTTPKITKRKRPRFAVVITHHNPNGELTKMYDRYVKSITKYAQGVDYQIVTITDGSCWADSINKGLLRAMEFDPDYYILSNDDMLNLDPDFFKKFAIDDGLSSWQIRSCHLTAKQMIDASLFGMSRDIFQRLGFMDTAYYGGMNFEDTDYCLRAHELGMPMVYNGCKVKHYGDQTSSRDPRKWEKIYRNEEIFRNKWKDLIQEGK